MKKQSGNVLFLILIAVALFAALSYAITQSTRSGSGSAASEQADILAGEIIQFAGEANASFQRLRISGGYKPDDIEYTVSSTGVLNSACTNQACRLNHPNGGRLINRPAPHKARRDPTSGSNDNYTFILGAIRGVGTAESEILLLIGNLNYDVCAAINKRLGFTGILKPISLGAGYFNLNDTVWPTPGVLPTVTAEIGEEAAGAEAIGKHSFCYCESDPCSPTVTDGDSIFISVMLER